MCVCVNQHFTSLHHLLYLYTANKKLPEISVFIIYGTFLHSHWLLL